MKTNNERFKFALFAAMLLTAFISTANAEVQMNGSGEEGFELSVILEPNAVSSDVTLVNCEPVLKGCTEKLKDYKNQIISYDIVGGAATFKDGTQHSSAVFNGSVVIPGIVAGPINDESFLILSDYNSNKYESVRIATVSTGNVTKFLKLLGDKSPFVLLARKKFALINQDMIENSSSISNQGVISGNGVSARGLCIRAPFGGGVVNWSFSNPKASGYSVAPESSKNLIWASGSKQYIDAIYRNSWGCGTAFKVPDNCTVTVSSNGGLSSCCNALMSLITTTRWINTMGNDVDGKYFPDCPLR